MIPLARSTQPTQHGRLRRALARHTASLEGRWERLLERHVRPRIVPFRIDHVAGPARVCYDVDEVLLMTIVRNGGVHTRPFLEHHFALGVRHVVLLDNGSTDDTVDVARSFDNVTILRTTLPYRTYENTLKRYLARRFSPQRWNLIVDLDERFDYPGSDVVRLPELIRYLEAHGATAVLAQMLDMFPDCTLGELDEYADVTPDAAHVCYDVAHIRRTPYELAAAVPDDVQMHWDGIRTRLFGTTHGLSKAALVRVGRDMDLFVYWHHVPQARLADFSAVLLHYPFAGGFNAKVRDAVETMRYGQFSVSDYAPMWDALRQRPQQRLRQPSTRRWRGVDALVEEGFLVTSPTFRAWLAQRRAAAGMEVRPG